MGRVAQVVIPVHVEPLEDGWHLAICDAIQGCHAEGDTVKEALENIEDAARILFELEREKGLRLDPIFEGVPADAVIKAQLVEGAPGV
ncbi:MAG: type II toxin-antitoxin system HicB family antitoxin [Dehalococcoidia bacterium]|nr:type II toxin-antitoxin system HicB family antitoxin [Dehalococcoidia bacterium]